jgi:hypothetical protein
VCNSVGFASLCNVMLARSKQRVAEWSLLCAFQFLHLLKTEKSKSENRKKKKKKKKDVFFEKFDCIACGAGHVGERVLLVRK